MRLIIYLMLRKPRGDYTALSAVLGQLGATRMMGAFYMVEFDVIAVSALKIVERLHPHLLDERDQILVFPVSPFEAVAGWNGTTAGTVMKPAQWNAASAMRQRLGAWGIEQDPTMGMVGRADTRAAAVEISTPSRTEGGGP